MKLCLTNAFQKSRHRMAHKLFSDQIERLAASGYPQHLLMSVSEGIHKKSKSKRLLNGDTHQRKLASKKEKNDHEAIYARGFPWPKKDIGKRVDMRIAVSMPHKL